MRSAWLGIVLLFMYLPVMILLYTALRYTATIGTHGNFLCRIINPVYDRRAAGNDWRHLCAGYWVCLHCDDSGNHRSHRSIYSKKGPRGFMDFANQIPVVNAEVVTGFSICVLLIVVLGLSKDSFFPLIVGHVVLEAPFVYLSVLPKLKQMDNSIYEAALDLAQARTGSSQSSDPAADPGDRVRIYVVRDPVHVG